MSTSHWSTQEETEFRSDGTKKVLRPARLSLARVSVLRGDGPRKGVPFIDDYIHTSEIIVDYLTEFSGIKCNSAFGIFTANTDHIMLSWRSRSYTFSLHLDAFEACIQEAASPSRLWLHIHRSWIVEGLSNHQYDCLLPWNGLFDRYSSCKTYMFHRTR